MSTNGPFRSAKTRKSFCKQNFKFVEPLRLNVGEDEDGKKLNIAYVPIDKSLKELYEHNKDHISLCKKNNANDSVLSDICDGAVFKANPLFLTEETYTKPALRLQTKHKILAGYYNLTNIQP